MTDGNGIICLCFHFSSHVRFYSSMSYPFGIYFVHRRERGLVFSTLIWIAVLNLELVASFTRWSSPFTQNKHPVSQPILNVITALPASHGNNCRQVQLAG